jgi:hypothetical protein
LEASLLLPPIANASPEAVFPNSRSKNLENRCVGHTTYAVNVGFSNPQIAFKSVPKVVCCASILR